MAAKISVLVAEDEYFIALEAERILLETGRCEVMICRRNQLASTLTNHRFELVVLDAGTSLETCEEQTQAILETGAKPVFLCAYADLLTELRKKKGTVVFEKPFREGEVKAYITDRFGRDVPLS